MCHSRNSNAIPTATALTPPHPITPTYRLPVNSSHGQLVIRSTRHTVISSQSTRHTDEVNSSYGQLVISGVTRNFQRGAGVRVTTVGRAAAAGRPKARRAVGRPGRGGPAVSGQLVDKPSRGQPTRGQANSWTDQLVDKQNRGQTNSWTCQLVDRPTRGQ
jgi:hypothetical protein